MTELSDFERALLEKIAGNPFAGQQDLADHFGLARSTVAATIVQLTRKGFIVGRAYVIAEPTRVVCYGGATLDRKYHALEVLRPATSNPVRGYRAFGGVARNVAENLARLGEQTSLVTIVGDDENGRSLIRHLQSFAIDTSHVVVSSARATGEYAAILHPDNRLSISVADMSILDAFEVNDIERLWSTFSAAAWVFADCNLPAPVLRRLISRRLGGRFKLAVDTVSASKAGRLPVDLNGVDLLFANVDEARSYLSLGASQDALPEDIAQNLVERGAQAVILNNGPHGLIVATTSGFTAVPAVPSNVVDITGAGDAQIAATLSRLLNGDALVEAASFGTLAAAITIEHDGNVHPEISTPLLDSMRHRLPTPFPVRARRKPRRTKTIDASTDRTVSTP